MANNGKSAEGSVVEDLTLRCSDGLELAAQLWKPVTTTSQTSAARRVLCLHGWLDNCQTFHAMIPYLVANNASDQIVALDLPGHGKSQHKSRNSPLSVFTDYLFYVYEALKQLGWEQVVLVGHSMGAAISVLYAATFPEQVQGIVLLDCAGPLSRKTTEIAKHVRKHVETRAVVNKSTQHQKTRVYPLDKAVTARCQAAQFSLTGKQYLSETAARKLVLRATLQHEGDGVEYVHDARLHWPSIQYLTDEQINSFYSNVQCPSCLLLAENGIKFEQDYMDRCLKLLKPNHYLKLPGWHHFHADPETSMPVAKQVHSFLEEVFEAQSK